MNPEINTRISMTGWDMKPTRNSASNYILATQIGTDLEKEVHKIFIAETSYVVK